MASVPPINDWVNVATVRSELPVKHRERSSDLVYHCRVADKHTGDDLSLFEVLAFLECARDAETEVALFFAQCIGWVDPGNSEGWQECG